MAEPYLSELRIFSFNFVPKGWAACNGQLLPINQNQALFSLLGTMYGGDGRTNFALPNLQGKVPMHVGNGLNQGQSGGEQVHTLTMAEMPAHTHPATASSNVPNVNTPLNNFWASNTGFKPYGNTNNQTMYNGALTSIGGNQGHSNMAPCIALNICIAVQGIFPSRT